MIIELSTIKNAGIGQLQDIDLDLSFEIEQIERQLAFLDKSEDWRVRAELAKSHMIRARKLVRTRLSYLCFDENKSIHGAILAEVRRNMPIDTFMSCVNRAKLAL